MKPGDLVKISRSGRWNLNHASQYTGIVVEAKKPPLGKIEIVYVSWPDKTKPIPISVRWLEVINENR